MDRTSSLAFVVNCILVCGLSTKPAVPKISSSKKWCKNVQPQLNMFSNQELHLVQLPLCVIAWCSIMTSEMLTILYFSTSNLKSSFCTAIPLLHTSLSNSKTKFDWFCKISANTGGQTPFFSIPKPINGGKKKYINGIYHFSTSMEKSWEFDTKKCRVHLHTCVYRYFTYLRSRYISVISSLVLRCNSSVLHLSKLYIL